MQGRTHARSMQNVADIALQAIADIHAGAGHATQRQAQRDAGLWHFQPVPRGLEQFGLLRFIQSGNSGHSSSICHLPALCLQQVQGQARIPQPLPCTVADIDIVACARTAAQQRLPLRHAAPNREGDG